MKNTTYQLILSTNGIHSVVVTSEDAAAIRAAESWASALYRDLVEQHEKDAPIATVAADKVRVPEVGEEAPICEIHHVAMVKVQGKKGPFWSCHQKNSDGSFCSYRPAKAA